MLFRKVVILSKTKDLAEFPGEKGLLGETKVSFVATDAHSASAQRGILHDVQDDTKRVKIAILSLTVSSHLT